MTEEFVDVTAHARVRWGERSAEPRLDPLAGFYEATEIHPCELEADEVRYHAGAGVVFVVRNANVTTVLDADRVDADDRPRRARVSSDLGAAQGELASDATHESRCIT
ncbi:MAG: hypothetical protein ABEJ79_00330 [Halolamina sp.]